VPGASLELRWGRWLNRQSSRQIGDRGEDLALKYLVKKGYALVERNYRTRHGEIDLIVRTQRALVFVEVKLRRGTGFGDPLEAVTPRKQARIRRIAEQYLAEKGEDFLARFDEVRFDVVGILLSKAGRPKARHVVDAF
jgi:putative endonuclease